METENSAYKTRIDNLQEQVSGLVEAESNREEQYDRLRNYIYQGIVSSDDPDSEAFKVLHILKDDFDFILIPKREEP